MLDDVLLILTLRKAHAVAITLTQKQKNTVYHVFNLMDPEQAACDLCKNQRERYDYGWSPFPMVLTWKSDHFLLIFIVLLLKP